MQVHISPVKCSLIKRVASRVSPVQHIRRTFSLHVTGDLAREAPEHTSSGWNGSVVDARDVEGFRGPTGGPASLRNV